MSIIDRLEQLAAMKRDGHITDAEFATVKARLLAEGVSSPPGPVEGRRKQPPSELMPDSHMVGAVLTTVFCFVVFGVIAIVHASRVETLWRMGEYDEAKRAAEKAHFWVMVGVGSGVVIAIMYAAVAAGSR